MVSVPTHGIVCTWFPRSIGELQLIHTVQAFCRKPRFVSSDSDLRLVTCHVPSTVTVHCKIAQHTDQASSFLNKIENRQPKFTKIQPVSAYHLLCINVFNVLSVCCSELTLYILSYYPLYFQAPVSFVCFLASVIIFQFSDQQSSPMQLPFQNKHMTLSPMQLDNFSISLEKIRDFCLKLFYMQHTRRNSLNIPICAKNHFQIPVKF